MQSKEYGDKKQDLVMFQTSHNVWFYAAKKKKKKKKKK